MSELNKSYVQIPIPKVPLENIFSREVLIEKWSTPSTINLYKGYTEEVWDGDEYKYSSSGFHKLNTPIFASKHIEIWHKYGKMVKIKFKSLQEMKMKRAFSEDVKIIF